MFIRITQRDDSVPLLKMLETKAPSDEGAGFLRSKKTEGEII